MAKFSKSIRAKIAQSQQRKWHEKAEREISAVVARSRTFLQATGRVPKYLIDNSAISNGITHRQIFVASGTRFWGGEVPIDVGAATRLPIYPDDSTKLEFRESCFLTGISELAKTGDIELCTSAELYCEMLRQPRRRYIGSNYDDLNLLNGIKIRSVDGYIFEARPSQTSQADRLNNICDPQYDKFRHLLRNGGTGQKISFDAWHLHTLEKYELDGFITMDARLVRALGQVRPSHDLANITTKVFLPSMLAEGIALGPIKPRLFTYREGYFFADHKLSAADIKATSTTSIAEKEDAVSIRKIVNVKEIQGVGVTPEMKAINIQYEAANGDLLEMSMSVPEAVYLLSMLKGIQLTLDIPFPDDPRDPRSPAIRPSERE